VVAQFSSWLWVSLHPGLRRQLEAVGDQGSRFVSGGGVGADLEIDGWLLANIAIVA